MIGIHAQLANLSLVLSDRQHDSTEESPHAMPTLAITRKWIGQDCLHTITLYVRIVKPPMSIASATRMKIGDKL